MAAVPLLGLPVVSGIHPLPLLGFCTTYWALASTMGYLWRKDIDMSYEDRVNQVVMYWPQLRFPTLRSSEHIVALFVLAGYLVWVSTGTAQRLMDADEMNYARAARLVGQLVLLALAAAVMLRSLHARFWPRNEEEADEGSET